MKEGLRMKGDEGEREEERTGGIDRAEEKHEQRGREEGVEGGRKRVI